ncbi:MAG: hypothetical protein KDA33_14495 [Phycisphaerales bacterium]|nr:hypothetical protein [Phycisphaerales bacterium]
MNSNWRHRRALFCGVCIVAILAAHDRAVAHPVSLSRAKVIVHSDHVDVTIEAPCEDLLHYGLIPQHDDGVYLVSEIRPSAAKYADMLRDGLILRDAAGRRLKAEIRSTETTAPDDDKAKRQLSTVWETVEIRYAANDKTPLDFVTFQHRPPLTTQILLTRVGATVQKAGDDRSRELVLTSGGNAETLEFNWEKKAAEKRREKDARAWLGSGRFNLVHAILETDSRGASLRVVVPLSVSETWRPIQRAKEDTLGVDEQAGVIEFWRDLFAKSYAVKVDGEAATPRLEDIALIGPATSERSIERVAGPIGFYSGRIVAVLRLSDNRDVKSIHLTWKLLNDAVLAAHVLVIEGGEATEIVASRYTPDVKWRK